MPSCKEALQQLSFVISKTSGSDCLVMPEVITHKVFFPEGTIIYPLPGSRGKVGKNGVKAGRRSDLEERGLKTKDGFGVYQSITPCKLSAFELYEIKGRQKTVRAKPCIKRRLLKSGSLFRAKAPKEIQ